MSRLTQLIFIVLTLFVQPHLMAADSYEIDFDTTVEINEHAVCRKFYNNNPTGSGVFVSTKTLAEYNSFINNLPPGVKECGCDAVIVGAQCWHYGGSNQSCDDVCASYDGYNAATRTYAGSGGTNANCAAVLDALGAPGGGVSTVGGGLSGAQRYAGCQYDDGKAAERLRGTDLTESDRALNNHLRACACNF